jgi:hypothetical protein
LKPKFKTLNNYLDHQKPYAMERSEDSFQDDEQLTVNKPFDFESNPNDSDYRMVKRVKLEREAMFDGLEGYVRLDKNSAIDFQIEPIEQTHGKEISSETFIKFTLFITNDDGDDDDEDEDEDGPDSKRVEIEASFCISQSEEESEEESYGHMKKPDNQDIYAIIKDQTVNLGRKRVFFLAKPIGSCSGQVHVEVVIKFLHERSLTEGSLNERSSSLIQDLAKLFDDKKQTDFNIVCDGETFKCHKAILAARSEVFYSMFQMSGSTEKKTGEVKVEDIDAKTMKSLLMYMYKNHFPGVEASMNLLYAADKYNLAELVLHCQESIMKNISDETVLDIAVSSKILASQEVYEAAKKFIDTRPIKSLKAGNAWKKFKKENPK